MKWIVGIKKAEPDADVIKLIFENLGCRIICGDIDAGESLFFVYSPAFEEINNSSGVWNYFNQLFDTVKLGLKAAMLHEYFIEKSTVFEKNKNGIYKKHILANISITLPVFTCTAQAEVHYPHHLTDEEIEQLKQQSEFARKTSQAERAVKYIKPALENKLVNLVLTLKGKDLTPLKMGHIFDLIQDDMGSNLNELVSNSEITRFNRSINHPSVFGLDSRHIVSSCQPPPKPMLLQEAKIFIANLFEKWIHYKNIV